MWRSSKNQNEKVSFPVDPEGIFLGRQNKTNATKPPSPCAASRQLSFQRSPPPDYIHLGFTWKLSPRTPPSYRPTCFCFPAIPRVQRPLCIGQAILSIWKPLYSILYHQSSALPSTQSHSGHPLLSTRALCPPPPSHNSFLHYNWSIGRAHSVDGGRVFDASHTWVWDLTMLPRSCVASGKLQTLWAAFSSPTYLFQAVLMRIKWDDSWRALSQCQSYLLQLSRFWRRCLHYHHHRHRRHHHHHWHIINNPTTECKLLEVLLIFMHGL